MKRDPLMSAFIKFVKNDMSITDFDGPKNKHRRVTKQWESYNMLWIWVRGGCCWTLRIKKGCDKLVYSNSLITLNKP